MHLEIVTHCFQYHTLLRYQLSSLVVWPPAGMHVTMTVLYTEDDKPTKAVLDWFGKQSVPGVTWQWIAQPVLELCHRSIGRNLAALRTTADWVWFCDADYWFDQQCWQSLGTQGLPADKKLVFPFPILMHRNHAMGDRCIEKARQVEGLVTADKADFAPCKIGRAIGGMQIARGDVCRELGYLRHSRRAQSPQVQPRFFKTVEDKWFRHKLGTSGTRVRIPGIYRIRHSQAGYETPGVTL